MRTFLSKFSSHQIGIILLLSFENFLVRVLFVFFYNFVSHFFLLLMVNDVLVFIQIIPFFLFQFLFLDFHLFVLSAKWWIGFELRLEGLMIFLALLFNSWSLLFLFDDFIHLVVSNCLEFFLLFELFIHVTIDNRIRFHPQTY